MLNIQEQAKPVRKCQNIHSKSSYRNYNYPQVCITWTNLIGTFDILKAITKVSDIGV